MSRTRIRLEYFDQNDTFGEFLPRSGSIERRLASENVDNYFLLRLDEPFDFQVRVDDFTFRNIANSRLIIRSRWSGQEVGELEPTSVFILLIPDPERLLDDPIDVNTFYHVAWGMAHTI